MDRAGFQNPHVERTQTSRTFSQGRGSGSVDGGIAYAIHAADGAELAVFDNRDLAMVAARQHDLEPVSVH